jgi:hypothetical protein
MWKKSWEKLVTIVSGGEDWSLKLKENLLFIEYTPDYLNYLTWKCITASFSFILLCLYLRFKRSPHDRCFELLSWLLDHSDSYWTENFLQVASFLQDLLYKHESVSGLTLSYQGRSFRVWLLPSIHSLSIIHPLSVHLLTLFCKYSTCVLCTFRHFLLSLLYVLTSFHWQEPFWSLDL